MRCVDYLDEARQCDELAVRLGSGHRAAESLGKSAPWVSQRRSLLRLTLEMQDLLGTGRMTFAEARKVAMSPHAEQAQTLAILRASVAHILYRAYDGDLRLLYVGITLHPAGRLRDHSHSGAAWWLAVSTITLERLPSRAALLAAERAAIRQESPAFNVQHAADAC